MIPEIVVMHYLPGSHLRDVLSSGYLDTTPKKEHLRKGEKPIVWFTTSEEYPKTAYKPVVIDGTQSVLEPDEMHHLLGGIFRLCGSTKTMNAYPWKLLKHRAKLSEKIKKRLVSRAKSVGEKPSTWYGSLERVNIDVLLLQKFNGDTGQWVNVQDYDESCIDEMYMEIERQSHY
jgi:hypothetical protein